MTRNSIKLTYIFCVMFYHLTFAKIQIQNNFKSIQILNLKFFIGDKNNQFADIMSL